jgi:hypothetical protein
MRFLVFEARKDEQRVTYQNRGDALEMQGRVVPQIACNLARALLVVYVRERDDGVGPIKAKRGVVIRVAALDGFVKLCSDDKLLKYGPGGIRGLLLPQSQDGTSWAGGNVLWRRSQLS